jgi:NitT/TauT family transport system permease protein
MSVAIERGDAGAMVAAIVAMMTMIVGVDQLFWRPLVAWSEKFNIGDVSSAEVPHSWVLDLLRKSGLIRAAGEFFEGLKPEKVVAPPTLTPRKGLLAQGPRVAQVITVGLLGLAAVTGAFKLFTLLQQVSGAVWLELLGKTAATFGRTTVSLVLGTLWTVPAGVLIGRSPTLSRVLQPVVQMAASFPAPMIFPLVLAAASSMHIGINYSSIALMVLGTQWYVLFNVIAGAMAIPHDLDEAAVMFHFTRAQRWKRVYLPGIFPHLVTGWVTAAGGAWNASIVGEFQTYKGHELVAYGLGGMIQGATNSGNFPELAAGAVTMAVVVVGINRVVWKRLYHLAEERYALSR